MLSKNLVVSEVGEVCETDDLFFTVFEDGCWFLVDRW
jgi:hypothetical protein